MKFDFQAHKFLAPIVILGSTLFTVACGDDDNPEPTKPPDISDEDAGGGGDDAGGGDELTTSDESTTNNVATDDTDETPGDASVDTDEQPIEGDAGVDTGEDTTTTLPDGGVNTVPVPQDDGGTTDEPQGCVENDDACFSCPSAPEQYPLQCTEGECKAFDNEARLGRYVPGEDLPEP
jgi:hypothetical protein